MYRCENRMRNVLKVWTDQNQSTDTENIRIYASTERKQQQKPRNEQMRSEFKVVVLNVRQVITSSVRVLLVILLLIFECINCFIVEFYI